MKASLRSLSVVLALAAVSVGCQTKESAKEPGKDEGPRGNPVLPAHGQRLSSGGAVQNVRQAARRTADLNELYNFSLAYYQYNTEHSRPPSKLDDLQGSLDSKTIAAFKEGFYVPVWNIRDTSSETVVAYVKDPDSYGTQIVATGDGKARRMTKQEFDAVIKRRP
jgi:hypothetical protein